MNENDVKITAPEEGADMNPNETEISKPVAPARAENETYEIIAVRFRPLGKAYYFDPNGKQLKSGDEVVVETSRGPEFGTVVTANKIVPASCVVLPLKKLLRTASQTDVQRHEDAMKLEEKAKSEWRQRIEKSGLEMALSDVECTFDRSKLIFYFTAEGRVDFREFVKELAGVFKMRIELRQIGVRDEAKQLGGLGVCGRPLCCATFLNDFQQVSIKMAKEQNLSLNSAKISGTCGRLMCCLRYESDTYSKACKLCPRQDQYVETPEGNGFVTEVNVLACKCKVRLDGDEPNFQVFDGKDLKVLPKPKKENQGQKK